MKSMIAFLVAFLMVPSAFGQTPWPTKQWEVAQPSRLGLNKDSLTSLDQVLAS